MKQSNLESMSTNELWTLLEKIRAVLSTKLDAEKHELEQIPLTFTRSPHA
jgi:hypothetical protein